MTLSSQILVDRSTCVLDNFPESSAEEPVLQFSQLSRTAASWLELQRFPEKQRAAGEAASRDVFGCPSHRQARESSNLTFRPRITPQELFRIQPL